MGWVACLNIDIHDIAVGSKRNVFWDRCSAESKRVLEHVNSEMRSRPKKAITIKLCHMALSLSEKCEEVKKPCMIHRCDTVIGFRKGRCALLPCVRQKLRKREK